MRRVPVKRAIGSMVRTIVEQFAPERIIFFRCHARGTTGPDSDVDLLVVMPVQGSKRDQTVKILSALQRVDIPMDLIVTTPEDFAWRKDVTGTIEYPAVHEGKVLYARK
jgi:predicted nucleotidyltransferase